MHPPQASLVCPLTKKRFKTRAAYENHVRSKKYAALLAKSTGEAQGDAPASAGAAGGTAAVGASAEPEALPAAPVVAAIAVTFAVTAALPWHVFSSEPPVQPAKNPNHTLQTPITSVVLPNSTIQNSQSLTVRSDRIGLNPRPTGR